MIMRLPVLPSGRRVDALVGLTDLAPTFLAAAGRTASTIDPDGSDLLPLAHGVACPVRDGLFGQYHGGQLGLYCAMDDRHKYVYSAADRRESLSEVGSDETVDLLDGQGQAGAQSGPRSPPAFGMS